MTAWGESGLSGPYLCWNTPLGQAGGLCMPSCVYNASIPLQQWPLLIPLCNNVISRLHRAQRENSIVSGDWQHLWHLYFLCSMLATTLALTGTHLSMFHKWRKNTMMTTHLSNFGSNIFFVILPSFMKFNTLHEKQTSTGVNTWSNIVLWPLQS